MQRVLGIPSTGHSRTVPTTIGILSNRGPHANHSGLLISGRFYLLISPTHKRSEERAPVWGSEFTTQAAELQGDSVEIAAGLKFRAFD